MVLIIAGILILLVVVPILLAQVTPGETRTLRGIDLEDTSYQEVAFPNTE
jgi:hypothetical protein